MPYNQNPRPSVFEIAELYLRREYEFPLLRNPDYADLKISRNLRRGFQPELFGQQETFRPRTERLSRAILDVFDDTEDVEEPNTDEVLRQEGFYDSNDPRCCINKARR
ncbi:MAG: hypothetical protein AABX54_02965 [Nanoarchaeota archaeon]